MNTCTVCRHDERLVIEQMLVNGKSHQSIADRFGVSRSAVQRHGAKCVPDVIAQAKQAEAELRGLRIVDRVRRFDQYVDEVIERARNPEPVVEVLANGETVTHPVPPNDRIILQAIKEGRANAELVAKMLGDLPPEDGADKARKALLDPETARMVAEVEERISGGSDAGNP